MNYRYPLSLLFLFWMSTSITAQSEFDLDEDALFGDTSTIVDSEQFTDSGSVFDETDQKSVSFSGALTGSVAGSVRRDYFQNPELPHTGFRSTTYGEFNLDIRLPRSVKSFVATNVSYTTMTDTSDTLMVTLNEMFLDWNHGYRVFFRFGKQVLHWGRGYFFNPVDLVNVEKKPFLDDLTGREGAFGLKAHIPFKTHANIYAFLDMGGKARIDELALALKAEALVQSVELALSVWGKENTAPVLGFDFSTSLWDLMVSGETALHRTLTTYRLTELQTVQSVPRNWVPRVSLGLGKYFDFGDINDRILINLEGYFNGAGTDRSDLAPSGIDMTRTDTGLFSNLETSGLLDLVFDQNNISRWYLAAFATINRFLVTEMSLSISGLANLNQRSALLTAGLNYRTLHNLSFDLVLSGFPGQKYTEYTITGEGARAEMRVGVIF